MKHTLIIGAGLAGLSVALRLADSQQVTIVAKRHREEAATAWAQGGIVGVLDEKDSIDLHVKDTMTAGAGLVSEATARYVAKNSAAAIHWLLNQGVEFTTDPEGAEGLHLTKEAGHSHRRIAHAADTTGFTIHQALLKKARAHPNITLHEHWIALDLISDYHRTDLAADQLPIKRSEACYGAYVLDINQGHIETFLASAVVIASGGVSKVYKYTTNPDTATGDGIAMAWRIGCRVGNMEFIQFHPTCLYHPEERTFLITEALRGEGAFLQHLDGKRFMNDYHELAELAPRDIVARAIDNEMKKYGLDCVWLDARHLGEKFLKTHFPTTYSRCQSLGINIVSERIPVVPAAHYTCGGVVTDHNGQTDVSGLFAVGEAAYTGLHGANRLASNSLLECVVFGEAVANSIIDSPAQKIPAIRHWDESQVEDADEQVVISHNWDELRALMGNYVGIARTTRRLQRALDRILLLRKEVHEYYANFRVSRDLIELRNLLECAELIVRSALTRHESRGLHFNRDYPKKHAVAYPTILSSEHRL